MAGASPAKTHSQAGDSGQSGSSSILATAPAGLRRLAPAGLAAARSGDLFRQIDERAADLRIIDFRIGADQTGGARSLQKAQPRIGTVGRWRGAHVAAEEKRDGNTEDVRDARQASGAHAVDAFFVFLHLLKGDAEIVCKLGLR